MGVAEAPAAGEVDGVDRPLLNCGHRDGLRDRATNASSGSGDPVNNYARKRLIVV